MKPSLVARYPDPPLTDGCIWVTTLTTAGLARAAAWTMAESSKIVTLDRRSTDCVLVRDCSCSTPRLTPPATSAASTTTPATTMTGRQRRAPPPSPLVPPPAPGGRAAPRAGVPCLTLPGYVSGRIYPRCA